MEGLEGIMLCEIGQSGKDKYHMISHMWNLMNKQNKNRLRDTENRLTAVRGEGVGSWVKKVKGL